MNCFVTKNGRTFKAVMITDIEQFDPATDRAITWKEIEPSRLKRRIKRSGFFVVLRHQDGPIVEAENV